MKTKMKLLVILIGMTVALQVGCSNQGQDNKEPHNQESKQEESNKDNDKQEVNDDINIDTDVSANDDEEIIKKFDDLLADEDLSITDIIQYIKSNISLTSKETATMMVERLEGEQEYYLSSIEEEFASEEVQSILIEAILDGVDYKDPTNIQDKDVKALLNKTIDNGYSIDQAEGYVYPIIDYSLYEVFSSYINEDADTYFNIMATEARSPFAKDAALIISWDEVIYRALATEAYLDLYGSSTKANLIRELHNRYLRVALHGLDNTPLFEYETKVMNDEAKAVYETLVDNYPDSKFISTLKGFMDIVIKNDYILNDEVIKVRDSIQG